MTKHLTAAALTACLLSLAPAASAAVPAPPHATAEAAPTPLKAADRHTAEEIRGFLRCSTTAPAPPRGSASTGPPTT
ncbi:hypothetical protein Sgou_52340 [Streptomyces gougerotii]|uniref:Uncharacterized protein n=1 Tax=Streptomyces gougerotii TaxID=53448 RepID=A0ABQ1DDD3_9ACTN|nr:hypothetical protein [Streptomyces gougerotii]GFH80564.1 hypothetical protein Sgou_52340 [Streptomyces gougerotii]